MCSDCTDICLAWYTCSKRNLLPLHRRGLQTCPWWAMWNDLAGSVKDLFGQVTSKPHTLKSHSCLLWNCKIIFWVSVSVTPFLCTLSRQKTSVLSKYSPRWKFHLRNAVCQKDQSIKQNKNLALWHSFTTSRWRSPCSLCPNHSFWADQPAKHHLKGIPPKKSYSRCRF